MIAVAVAIYVQILRLFAQPACRWSRFPAKAGVLVSIFGGMVFFKRLRGFGQCRVLLTLAIRA